MSIPRSDARAERSGRDRRHAAVVVAATLLLIPAACGGEDEPAAAADDAGRPAFGVVSTDQAAALATDPAVTVIDVRTPEEFAEGHIEGATLIDLSSPTFADDVARLDPETPYLVYCRSDNRSGQAVMVMQQLGFEQLWDLDGGVVAWAADGHTLVR